MGNRNKNKSDKIKELKRRKMINEDSKAFICSVCGCSLDKINIKIHDCFIRTFLDYKKSRSITGEMSDLMQEVFQIKKLSVELTTREIKLLDDFVLKKNIPDNLSKPNRNDGFESINTEFDKYPLFEMSKISGLFQSEFKIKSKVIFNNEIVNSFFSNEEIIHLALGVKQNEISSLARKYKKGLNLTDNEWFFLHKSMMNGVEKHGYLHIQKLLSISKIPFKIDRQISVFKMIDKLSNSVQKPVIRLKFDKDIFLCEFVDDSISLKLRSLRFYKFDNLGKRRISFIVNRQGVCKIISSNITPSFLLFQAVCSDSKQLILGYGLDEGKCAICNKPLTDPKSIRRGIGPICEQNAF